MINGVIVNFSKIGLAYKAMTHVWLNLALSCNCMPPCLAKSEVIGISSKSYQSLLIISPVIECCHLAIGD